MVTAIRTIPGWLFRGPVNNKLSGEHSEYGLFQSVLQAHGTRQIGLTDDLTTRHVNLWKERSRRPNKTHNDVEHGPTAFVTKNDLLASDSCEQQLHGDRYRCDESASSQPRDGHAGDSLSDEAIALLVDRVRHDDSSDAECRRVLYQKTRRQQRSDEGNGLTWLGNRHS